LVGGLGRRDDALDAQGLVDPGGPVGRRSVDVAHPPRRYVLLEHIATEAKADAFSALIPHVAALCMILVGCAHAPAPAPVAAPRGTLSAPAAAPPEGEAEARQALGAAAARLFALEVEAAAAAATQLLARIDAGDYGRMPRPVAEGALLLLVEASLALGDDARADDAADRLLALGGGAALDPGHVSPAVRA